MASTTPISGTTPSIGTRLVNFAKSSGKTAGSYAWTGTKLTATAAAKAPANRYVQLGIGLIAGLATLFGVYKDGTTKGMRNANEEMGHDYVDLYMHNDSSSSHSHVINGIQNFYRDYLFDSSIFPAWSKLKNATCSIVGEALDNIVTIGAAAVALAGPKKVSTLVKKASNKLNHLILEPKASSIGKWTAIGASGLLLLKGTKVALYDVMGIGKKGL